MRIIDGKLDGKSLKVAIVASRFNRFIVDRLVDGAIDGLTRAGVSPDDVTLVHCPGAFEIPQVAKRIYEAGGHDAIICLGCVIRGATPHFDYVAGEAAKGIGQLAASARVPIVFGVLTTDTIEQAVERAGTKAGNKGYDAALAAVEMAHVYSAIGAPSR